MDNPDSVSVKLNGVDLFEKILFELVCAVSA